MRSLNPTPATRRGQKARVALSGIAGAGKTWTALTIARELGEKTVVVDTERGSAGLYADEFEFDHVEWLPPFDPREVGQAIAELAATYDVVIVDSLSHFWEGDGGTMDIVDAAAAKSRGNSFAGWAEGTPAQRQLVDGVLAADAHVIVTMRSKTEYVLEQGKNGKTFPRKVGMAPVQRAGLEYEFTVTCYVDSSHHLMVEKTRCSALEGRTFASGLSGEFASVLAEWLGTAEPVEPPEPEPEWAPTGAVAGFRASAKGLDDQGKTALKAEMAELGVSAGALTKHRVSVEQLAALEGVLGVELDRMGEPFPMEETG